MQVVIFCGGAGTRLREETEYRPKPMVYIGDRPILWHVMKLYAHYGHTDFVLPLGYKGDMIKDYFLRYEEMNNDVTIKLGSKESRVFHGGHEENGWRITMCNTGQDTLKGGRLRRIERHIRGDAFMLTYGDGVADVDLDALWDFHRRHGKVATVTGVNPMARFGELGIDGDRVASFREKPSVSEDDSFINGGFFVLNRGIFDYLSGEEDCDFEYGALEALAAEGQLMVYRHRGYWACMDTLRDVEYLNRIWAAGQAPWRVW